MTEETYNAVLGVIAANADTPAENIVTCGACGFAWDDTIPTGLTPAPSARCPNEYNHPEET